ncbi:substrate-binding domain-containing protein [Pseudomonas moraviensis subsp. stanleyae]|uniref:substrate-binding domain-containing protein n=1 Tax=Pseudomonas moraviensis TaxID=321662 RepID=UPI002E32D2AB|nr:substrate-binding domain-containing protein [Pseudomonas moraviensis]MED7666685.1 substrate-binding domain-containing protein [Pseudomonas moraviensis subsp. stanleyae]
MTRISASRFFVILALLCFGINSAYAASVGASLLTQQHPFYTELSQALMSEAKIEGLPLEVAIANQDLNKQLADVEDFITKGVDVIIISPVDSRGVKSAIRKAIKAGIKVVTVDVPATGVEVTSHIGTDNFAGGVKAGELMAQMLNDKGNVAIIDYPTLQSVADRVGGFRKGLESHSDIHIVATQTGITRADALAAAQNMLQANPDITGIFGFGDDAALAAATAVHASKLDAQVKVIGFDGMQEARAAVANDPVMVGVIAQYPAQIGKLAVQTAAKVIKGQQVPALQPILPGVVTKAGEKP